METLAFTFNVSETSQELLIAELDTLGFEAFVQEETHLVAYIQKDNWDSAFEAYLQEWLANFQQDTQIHIETMQPQNWNTQWEASIQPIVAGRFIVKPTWATLPETSEDKIILSIDPKMSFGTGHHETTRLILTLLPNYIHEHDMVLDAGTGTGVLAIGAIKLGAKHAIAFDYDAWVEENVAENLTLNQVADQITYRTGTMDVITETNFDVILANINRSVLIDYMPAFWEKLKPQGYLLLAGILKTDAPLMENVVTKQGFKIVEVATENEWWTVVCQKENEHENCFH